MTVYYTETPVSICQIFVGQALRLPSSFVAASEALALQSAFSMDNIAHALVGAAIGWSGFKQHKNGGNAAVLAAIVTAEFPDIDILLGTDPEIYLRWHRSFTHSVVTMPIWAALIAGVFCAFAGKKRFPTLFGASLAGIFSHLVMDWLTNYGTLLLWPFSEHRFALSWVFIVDVYVWAMLLVALILAKFFDAKRWSRIGLAVMSAYFLACGASRAVNFAREPQHSRTNLYPTPMNPLRWTVIWEEPDAVFVRNGGEFLQFPKPKNRELLEKAEQTDAVKLFLWFADFPVAEIFQRGEHTVVRYRDARFTTRMPNGNWYIGTFAVARVTFDADGNIVRSEITSER
jgi:inner membrane protein